MDESEVDEAEGRGESEGEATAVDGEERSVSAVVDVTVRRRAGFLAGTAVDVEGAMMKAGCLVRRATREARENVGRPAASSREATTIQADKCERVGGEAGGGEGEDKDVLKSSLERGGTDI